MTNANDRTDTRICFIGDSFTLGLGDDAGLAGMVAVEVVG